jgi:hypothetical protein
MTKLIHLNSLSRNITEAEISTLAIGCLFVRTQQLTDLGMNIHEV